MNRFSTALLVLLPATLLAQTQTTAPKVVPKPTNPAAVQKPTPAKDQKEQEKNPFQTGAPVVTEPVRIDPQAGPWQNLIGGINPREIGPSNMGGRIADFAVYEKEPRIFYVATASGGLWKTENAGITMKPVFDREETISLGATAVSQKDPNLVWVGTGEASSRNSVAWGDGVYKSTDGGKTWKNMGLKETMSISKIVIDPKDNNVVYVAAMGRLWGTNSERGIYKTIDGGKTWEKVLYHDEKTGCIDLQMDPSNHDILIAALWQRQRSPYQMISGGPGSGIYKSINAGKSWYRIDRGLPLGDTGRIGISFFRKDPKKVIATIEHNKENGLYKSFDRGESWKKINPLNPRPFYFSRPMQDPNDENRIYEAAVSVHFSDDAGKTFKAIRLSVHVDNHAIWVDPNDSNHILIGNDGGVGQSRDRGLTWEHVDNLPVGQFYAVTYDMRRPYWVYGGLQDNNSYASPTQSHRGGVIAEDAIGMAGGDGFHVQVDPTDWATTYSESQGGALERIDLKTGSDKFVRPSIKGEKLRFNWSTPFVLSPHNPQTLYLGANRLFKSVDRGDHWKPISPDLTTNNPKQINLGEGPLQATVTGAEQHCTIITLSESEMKAGLLWVGTDDGLVHVSQDDGATWTNVTPNIIGLPEGLWCSRVTASRFEEGRCYATFDGHRSNNFKSYVYVTEDFGKTWKSLADNLPDYDSVYVITEGQKNPDLLYLGSELSLRMSFDRGKTWSRYRTNFPTVAIHDLVVQPRDLDLLIATHGRSIWTLDVSALEQLTEAVRKLDVALLKPQDVIQIGRIEDTSFNGDRKFVAKNTQPGTKIYYWLGKDLPGDVKITVSDLAGKSIDLTGKGKAGLNFVSWNGRLGRAGETKEYKVSMTVAGKEYTTTVTSWGDPDGVAG